MAKGLSFKVLMQLQAKEFTQGLKSVQKQLNTFKNYMKSAFALGSVTMFGKQVIEVGKNFEDAMAKVQAVSNATTSEFQAMQKEAQKMGETTRYTATDAANALENLTRNGMSATNATKSLSSVLQLAQANAIDLAQAADIMTNVMNAYGLSVDDAQRINDVMSTTAANAATNITDLYEALAEAGPYAKIMNKSIEEVSAGLGVLANNGIKGSTAGKAMAAMFQRLSSVSPKAEKVLKQYGITISEDELKSEDFYSILQKLASSGIGNSVGALSDLFGKNFAGNIAVLINNLEGFQTMLTKTQNSAGTTARMFDQSVGSVQKELDTLKSSYEGLLISISQKTSGVVKGAIKLLQNLIGNFKTVGGTISNLASVVVPLLASQITKLTVKFKVLYADMKTRGAAATAMMGGWITLIATLVTWVGTALVGAWNREHRAMKEANKAMDEAKDKAFNLQNEVDNLKNKLGTESDKSTLAGVVAEATRLFPDFADAINNAAKVASQTDGYQHLKDVLQDIVELQNALDTKSAKEEIADATAETIGENLWANSGARGGIAGFNSTGGENRDLRKVNNEIIKSLKDNNFSKDRIKNYFKYLGEILVKYQEDPSKRAEELKKAFSDFNIEVSDEDFNKWLAVIEKGKLMGNTDLFSPSKGQVQGGRQASTEAHQADSVAQQKDISIAKGNFEDELAIQKEALKKEEISQEDYQKKMEEKAQECYNTIMRNNPTTEQKAYAKQIKDDFIKPKKKTLTTTTTTTGGGGGGGDTKTNKEKIQDIIDDYNKSKTELDNKKANNAIADEDYKKQLDDLEDTTYRDIAAFGKLDEVMNLFDEKGKSAINGIKSAYETNGSEAKKKADEDKAKDNAEKWSNYVKPETGSTVNTRDTTFDYSKTGKAGTTQKLNEDYQIAQERVETLKATLEDLQSGTFGDGGEVANAINEITEAIKKAETEANSFKTIADLSQMSADLDELNVKFTGEVYSSISQTASGIESMYNAWKSFSEAMNDTDMNGFEKVMTTVDALLTTFESILTVMELLKEAEETYAQIKQASSKKAIQNTLAEAAASSVASSAEAGEAIAGATKSGAKLAFPFNILAIAAGVAAVIGALAMMSKFADGGIVGGNSTTGDKQVARVNSGELILNKAQQGNLYNAIASGNLGGGNVEFRLKGTDLIGSINNTKSRLKG